MVCGTSLRTGADRAFSPQPCCRSTDNRVATWPPATSEVVWADWLVEGTDDGGQSLGTWVEDTADRRYWRMHLPSFQPCFWQIKSGSSFVLTSGRTRDSIPFRPKKSLILLAVPNSRYTCSIMIFFILAETSFLQVPVRVYSVANARQIGDGIKGKPANASAATATKKDCIERLKIKPTPDGGNNAMVLG